MTYPLAAIILLGGFTVAAYIAMLTEERDMLRQQIADRNESHK